MKTTHQILKQYWGYDQFRPLQEEIIESVLQGKDTLGLMPTGGGKSLTFQVPAMMMDGICIVITPLIALMKDQVENLKSRGIKAATVYSGMTRHEIIVALENCIFGKYKFLYVSPERLSSELFLAKLGAMKVNLIVVDESHCISQWGYDFRPSYLKIASIREHLKDVPVLALTATATPDVVKDIQNKLLFRKENVFRKSFLRSNLAYVVRKSDNKMEMLAYMLNRVPGSAIVFVRSRKKTKEIAESLLQQGISADYYHAGLTNKEKDFKQKQWKTDVCRVIVCTNAFGMGIDKPDVRVVVHFDLPNSPEEYFQEAGRAGRDEQKAYAVILYSKSDQTKLKKRITDTFPERDFIKRVYDSLGNFLQIAVGSGFQSVFDFNLAKFCASYKLPALPTYSALKIIEQAGYIEYAEDVDNLSRIIFTVGREELYKLTKFDQKTDQLIQCVLRSYTGLFADYSYIQEDLIAQRANLTLQEVYERMIALTKQHILHYVPRKKTSLVIYNQSREEIKYMSIPKAVYEDRKEKYEYRINNMLNYAIDDQYCRSRVLLRYFGENDSEECGICDVCAARKSKKNTESEFEQIRQLICNCLQNEGKSLTEIINQVNAKKETIIEVARFLIDQSYLRLENNKYYLNEANSVKAKKY